MTTEYVVAGETATVGGLIETLKHFEGPLESLHEVYLINSEAVLLGAVPLARILLAGSETPLLPLAKEPPIQVPVHADTRTVVDLFHKYNLLTLPVVDDHSHLIGLITADDVLELVVKRR
jgi:magnesium transporter